MARTLEIVARESGVITVSVPQTMEAIAANWFLFSFAAVLWLGLIYIATHQ